MSELVVDMEKFEKIYKAVKRTGVKEVTFEYIVGSCFPDVMKNIERRMMEQHTLGYIDGYNKGLAEANKETSE